MSHKKVNINPEIEAAYQRGFQHGRAKCERHKRRIADLEAQLNRAQTSFKAERGFKNYLMKQMRAFLPKGQFEWITNGKKAKVPPKNPFVGICQCGYPLLFDNSCSNPNCITGLNLSKSQEGS